MSRLEEFQANSREEQFLYAERPFEYIDKALEEIRKLESGEVEKIKLSPEDREFILEFEESLGTQLEAIFDITPRSTTIYLEYFATPEGRSAIKECAGIDLDTTNLEEIRKILWENDQLITNMEPPAKRKRIAGNSSDFANDLLLQKMKLQTNAEGELDVNGINPTKRIQLILNPDDALKKIKQLRAFKQDVLAGEMQRLRAKMQPGAEQLDLAAMEILKMYRRRVNVMIMDMYQYGLSISQKRKIVGETGLNDTERELLAQFPGISEVSHTEKSRSRIDKAWHGASRDNFDENGWRVQVPQSIVGYAEKLAQTHEEIELTKSEKIKGMGLDEKKLFEENLSPETTAEQAEEILEAYFLKSRYPRDAYSPDREGPAPDGKWQVVLLPGETTLEPDFKQKALKDSDNKKKSIIRAMSVECGHEIAHILQSENQKKIPLRLIKKIGGSQFEIFSEGGAMHCQNEICRRLFGFEKPPSPHYTKAMLRKLEGGNYIDCVKTYYESCIKPIKEKLKRGKMSRQDFDGQVERALETAIDATKRLFANGTDFESTESFLTNSRDTVYLEQRAVLEKLEKFDLMKLASLRGVGLHDMVSLVKLGLMNLDDLIEYKHESVEKIWEREKPKYLLKGSS